MSNIKQSLLLIAADYINGLTLRQLQEKYKTNSYLISKELQKVIPDYNQQVKLHKQKKLTDSDKESIIYGYKKQGMTLQQLAGEYEVCFQAIHKIVKKANTK